MRAPPLVAALGVTLAVAGSGCAGSPAHPTASFSGDARPHPILAEAVPAGSESPAAPASRAPRAREESMDDRVARQNSRALGWVLLSVGAESAVVATITSFMMLHQNSVRSADCVDKVCSTDGLSANTTLHNLEWWNAGAWVVAVAGLGAGAFVLWTNPSDKALQAEVGVAPTGSGPGVLLRGAF
jgi:hypothetical protein